QPFVFRTAPPHEQNLALFLFALPRRIEPEEGKGGVAVLIQRQRGALPIVVWIDTFRRQCGLQHDCWRRPGTDFVRPIRGARPADAIGVGSEWRNLCVFVSWLG